jgi:hypothetical protein
MKQTKLDCWVGGGGLRIFLYLVAVAEKEKNEIPEPDFGEDKVWCVSRPLFFASVLAEEIDTVLLVTLKNKICCSPFHSEISCQMK